MRVCHFVFTISICLVLCGLNGAQTATARGSGHVLSTQPVPAALADLLKGNSAAWNKIPPNRIALNRTPPLFDTDEPAPLEISTIDVRAGRSGGKLLVQLSWKDSTNNSVVLAETPNTAPETRFLKVPTEAEDRFFDAAAVMIPIKPAADAFPSLQMGDNEHSVEIYYWNATRGSMVMQAHGRSTTTRSGRSFPVSSKFQDGRWSVIMELPDLPAGTPVAFAVWNGSQSDRDGRKYFSVWQVLQ